MSGAEVRYTFTAAGHDSVIAAFKGVGQAAEEHSAKVRQSGAVAQSTERKQKQNAARSAALQRKWEREDRAIAARRKNAAIRAENAALEQSLKASIRGSEKHVAAIERGNKQTARSVKSGAEIRAALRAKEDALLERSVNKQIRATEKGLRTAERAAKGSQKVARAHQHSMHQFSLGSQALTAGILGVGIAGAGIARVTGKAVRENWDLETLAAGIATRGSLGEKRMSTAAVQRQLQETAVATPGITAEDIGAGVQAFIAKIGKGKEAMGFRDIMATMASASGAKAEDLGGTMADLYSKLGIESRADMQEALARLHVQGKTGAFELRDFAKYAPRIFAATRVFGADKGVEGAATIGGLMQMVRGTVGSGAMAATGVENLLQTLVKKRGEIGQRLGVQVFDPKGQARKLPDILAEIAGAAGGDKRATAGIFTERGERAMNAFMLKFKELREGSKDNVEALAKLKQAIQDAIDAPGAWEESMRDAAQNQETTNAKLAAAWEGFKLSILDTAQPAITSFVQMLVKNAPEISTAIGEFVAAVAEGTEAFAQAIGSVVDLVAPGTTEKQRKKKEAREAAQAVERAQQEYEATGGEEVSPGKKMLATVRLAAAQMAHENLIREPYLPPAARRFSEYISGTEFQKRLALAAPAGADPGAWAKTFGGAFEKRAQEGEEEMMPLHLRLARMVTSGQASEMLEPTEEAKRLFAMRRATITAQKTLGGEEGDYARNLDNSAKSFSDAVISAGNTVKATLESISVGGWAPGGTSVGSVWAGEAAAVVGAGLRMLGGMFGSAPPRNYPRGIRERHG